MQMTSASETTRQFAARYIEFCNDPAAEPEGLREFYADDVVWREMPHQFAPAGRTHDLAGLQAVFAAGQKMMAEQHYVLDNVVASEDAAALQIRWEMTLAQDLGTLAAGDKLCGNLAIFFRLRDGKIVQQADYLSYDPR
jgi:ketosteroid isomerase-like protein